MEKPHKLTIIMTSESTNPDGTTTEHQTLINSEGCNSPQELTWKATKMAGAIQGEFGSWAGTFQRLVKKAKGDFSKIIAPWDE